ncbi:MAG: hypothetical protein H7235_06445 [Bdellovibrionaceae bacterium]|nr:hypothetical protein [Pseudobdellovibrionaceae bacterium]
MSKITKIDIGQPETKQPQKPYQDKITPNKYKSPEVKEPGTTDKEERIVSDSSRKNNLGKPEAPA